MFLEDVKRNMKTLIKADHPSFGLGDIICMMPYIERFRLYYESEVHLKVKNGGMSSLFANTFPEVKIFSGDSDLIFDREINLLHRKLDKSLQKIFASQLGFLDAEYLIPQIDYFPSERPIKAKYAVISVQSTSQLKYWNHPSGKKSHSTSPNWNDLCRMLRKSGITPICVDNYEIFGFGNFKNYAPKQALKKIGLPLEEVIGILNHAEFFIGLSSGLSWLAHAMGKKVCMISNFTEDWYEFDLSVSNYKRITDKSVCHGCWNKVGTDFDFVHEDWYWCPRHQGTDRQFECHTSITPERVFNEVKEWI